MKDAYDRHQERRAMMILIAAAILFACALGFILDRVLEVAG